MDSLMSVIHSQINKAIRSVVKDRVIPEIQKIMGLLSSSHRDTESRSSGNGQENNELRLKISKNDSRSPFDLRNTEDLSSYTQFTNNLQKEKIKET